MPKGNRYDTEHLRNVSSYLRQIDEIFKAADEEAARIAKASGAEYDPDKVFSFDDYPSVKKRVDRMTADLSSRVERTIVNGIKAQWELSNRKNDDLVETVTGLKADDLPSDQRRRWFATNEPARDAFIRRETEGMNLSEEVWRFRRETELGIDLSLKSLQDRMERGLSEGVSAADMSRELRGYLKNPDKLFRRVRDERGNLTLSRNARLFHPGQGVYRSSYMNARRLAATETNMAYRSADHERWRELDFVVGIEIRTSNNHTTKDSKGKPQPLEDICDTLAGRYPKDFKFVGWHPHCRCIATTILKTEEEMQKDTERIMDGEEPLPPSSSANYEGNLPEKFTKWLDKNSDRIENAKSLPYFLKDNEELIDGATANAGGGGGGNTLSTGGGGGGEPPANNNGNGGGVAVGGDDNKDNNGGGIPKTLQEQVDEICLNPTKGKPLTFDELQDEYFVEGPWNLSGKKLELCYKQGIAGKFDFAGVKEDITKLAKLYGIDITDCRIDIQSSNRFNVVYSGKGFFLERSFYTDANDDYKLKVTHKYLTLAEEYQGKGISKGVIRSLYGRYVDMGVEEINVYANIDVGGYTWARYGFSASRTTVDELISSTNRLNDSAKQNALDFIKDYYDSHNLGNDEPFPMNKLVDYLGREEAKRILMGKGWHGEIDLSDDEQRKIFEEYMGYKKKDK